MNKPLKLTLKTAKLVVEQELRLPASKLKQVVKYTESEFDYPVYIFEMMLGAFEIKVENDWYDRNGRIRLQVRGSDGSDFMQAYIHPKTLERDFAAEDKMRRAAALEARKEWVHANGPEYCKAAIDQIWAG